MGPFENPDALSQLTFASSFAYGKIGEMGFSTVKHPAWTGVVLPVILGIVTTITPGVVRPLLLVAAVLSVTATYHHTEHGGQRWKRTGIVGVLCCAVAAGVFFVGRKIDARLGPTTATAPSPLSAPPESKPAVDLPERKQRVSATSDKSSTQKLLVGIAQSKKKGSDDGATQEAKPYPPSEPTPTSPPSNTGATINNCPNGICISGGTVTNPQVFNTPPPAKLKITPLPPNQQRVTNGQTKYQSYFAIDVSASSIPQLSITVVGEALVGLDCGQRVGSWNGYAVIDHRSSCAMNNVFGDNWQFSLFTSSPVSADDLQINIECSGATCIL